MSDNSTSPSIIDRINYYGLFLARSPRLNRGKYFFSKTTIALAFINILCIVGALMGDSLRLVFVTLILICLICLVYLNVHLDIKRLHDLGRPDWELIFIFIPIFNIFFKLSLYLLKGDEGVNIYGKNPASERWNKTIPTIMTVSLVASTFLTANWFTSTTINNKARIQPNQLSNRISSSDGKCRITVPLDWSKSTTLTKEAIIQASNASENQCVVILRDQKADLDVHDIHEYAHLVNENLKGIVKVSNISTFDHLDVDGMTGIQYQVDGTNGDANLTYLFTIIEAKDKYFQIFIFSPPSIYSNNKFLFRDIAGTFTLLE